MFGLGKNDDEQRLWNLILFKVPLTDKEIEDASPILGVVLVIVIIAMFVGVAIFAFGKT